MRRARAAVALATLGLLVSAPDAGAAEGATITAVGWWTSVPVMSAPEGGVAVGRGGSGPIAVAALRFSVEEESPATAELTLTEADGIGADAATLQVCPTPNDWEPVAAGAMAEAPRPECGRGSVMLERADDGTWSGDVAPLLEPGQPSLMVLPGEADAAESAPTPPFQLSFDPPALSAPAAATASPQADATPAPRPTPAPTATPAPGPASSFSPPPLPAASAATTTTVPSPEPEPTDEVAIGPSVALPTATTATASEDRPWGQMLFFLVVSALAGTVAGVGRRQLRLRRA